MDEKSGMPTNPHNMSNIILPPQIHRPISPLYLKDSKTILEIWEQNTFKLQNNFKFY